MGVVTAVLACLLLACAPSSAEKTVATLEHSVADGFDWSLPASVQPAPYAGLFYMDKPTTGPAYVRAVGYTLTWHELNPAENTYDFSKLETMLEKAAAANLKVVLRLKASVVSRRVSGGRNVEGPFVPQWVIRKYNPPQFHTRKDGASFITVAAPWHTGVQAAYERFVKELGSRGVLAHEALAGMYVHGISSSFGEEFSLKRGHGYAENAEKAGMTEDVIFAAFEKRIAWWAKAAGEHRYKLAWVNYGGIQERSYDRNRLNAFALKAGLGWREGGIENYHKHFPPSLGQSYHDGYVITDWSYPLRAEKRYFGEEAEFVMRKGSPELRRHLVESSLMRAAQLGMNFLWISPETAQAAPEMLEWFSLVAGKLPAHTPDAVCWLRQDMGRVGAKVFHVKNFERLLYQRDFSDARTEPARKIERPKSYQDVPGMHFDYSARSIEAGKKSSRMLFFVDTLFKAAKESLPATVKVTYYDEGPCTWQLSVSTSAGVASSAPIACEGGNRWRTATFRIEPGLRTGKLDHGADFELRALSGKRLTVRFVRVIRG